MTRLGCLAESILQSLRRQRLHWLYGVRVSSSCKLGRDLDLSGNIRIGRNVTLDHGVKLTGEIAIGDNCSIGRDTQLYGNVSLAQDCVVGDHTVMSTASGASLRVGVDTYINSYNVIGSSAGVEIGDHCIFAAFVYITDATHGIADLATATKHAPISASPVRLGNNVWLGSGVMVMMGASIGNDAVVGAQSLVRDPLPDRSISVGTPARVVRIRE
ncbi:MAG TPA: DapH/DapD/GlmU-related protein [Burkholderiales bacterium]